MSTLKVTNLQHPSSASANVTLDASGNADFNGKNLAGVASVNGSQLGGNRNIVINGAMTVAQRGTSASVSDGSNEGYQTLDRWRFVFGNSAGGACTISKDTDVPSGYGFSNSYKVDVTTADTSIASGHHIVFHQRIEAQDLRNSGWNYTSSSSYLTLSFWVKSNKTGTYCIDANAVDVGGNFKFVKEYTIDSASTWEYKTIKIPGNTSLVINNDANSGMEIEWNLQTASDRANATDNTWHTSDGSRCTSNQVNFFDSTDNNFWITGVQLEVGGTATSFEHESYGTTLQKCHRYFEKITYPTSQYFAVGFVNNGSRGRFTLTYNHKRTTPSVSFTGSNLVYYSGSTNDSSTLTAEAPGLDSTRVNYELDNNTNQANGAAVGVLAVSGGVVMDVDAEL